MRVAPELRHEDLRLERLDQRRDDLPEGPEIQLVVGFGKQRDVHGRAAAGAFADLLREPSPGKQCLPGFVDRDRHHARVPVKRRLHPIAMVGIDIQVDDAIDIP